MTCASYWAPPAGGYSGGYPRFLGAMIQDPLYRDFLDLARAGYPDFLGAMIEDPLSPDFLAGAVHVTNILHVAKTGMLIAILGDPGAVSQQIDANQLMEYLKSPGFFGSCYSFCLQTCRSMIAMLDQHFSGKIGFYEFKGLLILLKQWQGTFIECSTDQSGTLGRDEFRAALSSLGYRLSLYDVDMIVNRYPTDYPITFDEFVAWCVHLKPSTEARDLLRTAIADSSLVIFTILLQFIQASM